ncbi:metalloregulator ArsR/SmtB family transcription factor [Niallia taxi]|nr:metalloregulator ArsR/SmtB family transcription factor [Niallia taxi]MCT2347232.1 helix-turn-helix domain-containing protein [Niallia taxi]MDE5054435.1 metalloregulator ArsR/SmtB family transcription factor [Niallia taxi]MED3961337.1 metalloregulator ArsR/SmtB family transcription factor [Niallia taxi]
MDTLNILKAISNESRMQILYWLKNPHEHFHAHTQKEVDLEKVGVCVSQITKKLNMTQSTVSQYLAILQRADLLHATRIGKWTYYRRNEEVIKQFGLFMLNEL